MAVEELNESRLGTKTYWDALYQKEVHNFIECGEQGEIWFGQDSVDKMINWTEENIPMNAKIIDLGMGNGHIIFELIKSGYTRCLGVDYSENAVALARNIQERDENQNIKEMNLFQVMDLLDLSQLDRIGTFDFCLDKGTFDAISLGTIDPQNLSPADQYVNAVHKLLNTDGVILITSCNWTSEELITRFTPKFALADKIKYPVFKFGGVEGQKITTLAFKKRLLN